MFSKPSPKLAVVSLAFVLGLFAVPIDQEIVAQQSAARMGRVVFSELLAENTSQPIVLDFAGDSIVGAELRALIERRKYALLVEEGAPVLSVRHSESDASFELSGTFGDKSKSTAIRKAEHLSLLPPLIAVLLALLIRNIVASLFMGIWAGVTLLKGGNPLLGLWAVFVDYVYPVLTDSFNLQILGFTLSLVGMVAVVGRMGGTKALVNAVSRFAKGPRSAQTVTASMGTVIFFDDYANTLVVGTTARALTDKLRVSREKLAYIVDSTSAPVAGIAIISTWVGYEVGLFDGLLVEFSHVVGVPSTGYGLFFSIIPLRFYCIFALVLVFLTAFSGRDLGAMYRAEKRVRAGGPVSLPKDAGASSRENAGELSLEKPGVPPRMINAIIPVGSVLTFIAFRIWQYGHPTLESSLSAWSIDYWRLIFINAGDHMGEVLLVAGLVGSLVAFGMSFFQGLLTPKEALQAYGKGMRTLSEACMILILAWVIKNVCSDSSTGLALVGMVAKSLPAAAVPLTVFFLAGIVAFSTGSSWGTMALLLPVAAPLATALSGELVIILASMGAVLDGAIWGDHCSPISDTTVLSSTATGCPHMDHVKTQFPYATLAMLAAGGFGYWGYAMGLPILVIYLAGIVFMGSVLLALGKKA